MWTHRKIFTRLSSILIFQLLFILIFMLCASFVGNNFNDQWLKDNVKFIAKEGLKSKENHLDQQQYKPPTFLKIVKNDNFYENFIDISQNEHKNNSSNKLCFRDGIDLDNLSKRAFRNVNDKTELVGESMMCPCRQEWHGSACGEPEIIWRALLMTSSQIKSHTPKVIKKAHNIFYIIHEVTSINLETLEIQILELKDIVNLFILCDKIISEDPMLSIKHHMNTRFLQDYKDQILLIKDETCSSINIYNQMKRILGKQMRPLDILVVGMSDEILNKKVLKYLKWHNNWHQPLRFRLKWNVYGFFFQHPELTVTRSFACQLNILEQSSLEMLKKLNTTNALILGDLNHFGGWFCEYCYQPIDIIRKFYLDSKSLNSKSSNLLPTKYHREPVINSNYIENLISNSIYIDGKLQLKKLRNYYTKYFIPETVAKNKWKFDNIVTNFYAVWKNEESEEDY
jgi:beta-1,4-mannosyl-glycoprotein beta-1,4-N-acetylglucosaminyltransferase